MEFERVDVARTLLLVFAAAFLLSMAVVLLQFLWGVITSLVGVFV